MNAWDSPLRTRRLEYGTNREIPQEEFNAHNWYNVTSHSDPEDAHVYVKIEPRIYPPRLHLFDDDGSGYCRHPLDESTACGKDEAWHSEQMTKENE